MMTESHEYLENISPHAGKNFRQENEVTTFQHNPLLEKRGRGVKQGSEPGSH